MNTMYFNCVFLLFFDCRSERRGHQVCYHDSPTSIMQVNKDDIGLFFKKQITVSPHKKNKTRGYKDYILLCDVIPYICGEMSSSNTKVLPLDLAAIAASPKLQQFLLDPCSPCDDEPSVASQPTSIRNQHKQAKMRFPPSSSAPSSTTRCLIFESNIAKLGSNGDWYNIEDEHVLPIEVQQYLELETALLPYVHAMYDLFPVTEDYMLMARTYPVKTIRILATEVQRTQVELFLNLTMTFNATPLKVVYCEQVLNLTRSMLHVMQSMVHVCSVACGLSATNEELRIMNHGFEQGQY
jgi:hypothetical protein